MPVRNIVILAASYQRFRKVLRAVQNGGGGRLNSVHEAFRHPGVNQSRFKVVSATDRSIERCRPWTSCTFQRRYAVIVLRVLAEPIPSETAIGFHLPLDIRQVNVDRLSISFGKEEGLYFGRVFSRSAVRRSISEGRHVACKCIARLDR